MKRFFPSWLLWALLGILQLAVPASMVIKQETILSQGTEFRFRLAPVDPGDPFRGRYLRLSFEVERKGYTLQAPAAFDKTRPLYAAISTDSEGFARIDTLTTTVPTGPYLTIPAGSLYKYGGGDIHITIPFHRYFVNESRAKIIETEANDLLRKAQKEGRKPGLYGTVRIKDGDGSLTGLWSEKGKLE
jgi:uncharacterized membrane-anchored protein